MSDSSPPGIASESPALARLERQVRWLTRYAAVATLAAAALVASAFRPDPTVQKELTVERLNVVDPSGRPVLVIANAERLPGITYEGRELSKTVTARRGAAGMLFFNGRGDEIGGLTYRLRQTDSGYTAVSSLTLDQFRQDQVVDLEYYDAGKTRTAGLNVWDRSPRTTLKEVVDVAEAFQRGAGPRDSLERRARAMDAENAFGTRRVYVGSENRTALLRLNDMRGRPRIRLLVDSAKVARLEFLDDSGRVVRAIGPSAP